VKSAAAVGYQCLPPYYGYLPDYDNHSHDQNDSTLVTLTLFSSVMLLHFLAVFGVIICS